MIARIWRGWAVPANVSRYRQHFEDSVRPHISALSGFRGCLLLQGGAAPEVEIVAITMWESLDHIRAFAGEDIGTARVEPAAIAVLSRYQKTAEHFEVSVLDFPHIDIR